MQFGDQPISQVHLRPFVSGGGQNGYQITGNPLVVFFNRRNASDDTNGALSLDLKRSRETLDAQLEKLFLEIPRSLEWHSFFAGDLPRMQPGELVQRHFQRDLATDAAVPARGRLRPRAQPPLPLGDARRQAGARAGALCSLSPTTAIG
ncbi:MAG: hypothetical protein ACLQOO_34560 [Terriglobia bacterium]